MLASVRFLFVLYCAVCFSEAKFDDSISSDLNPIESVELIEHIKNGKSKEKFMASLDQYLDRIVNAMNTQITCPIVIPDYNVSVNTEILIIPIVGTFKLYNAEVKQIGVVTRSGDALAEYIDEVLTINMALEVKYVKFGGNFIAKLEMIGPSGSLSGGVYGLKAQAKLSVDVNKLQVTITDFFLEAGSVDIKVNIFPVLNLFINSLIKLITFIIQWPILSMISSNIREYLQEVINSYTQILQ